MTNAKYTIGIDYGTESGRVVIIDVADGRDGQPYTSGVIDDYLPGTDTKLEPDWALQDPQDYLAVLEQTVPQALVKSGVDAIDIIGIGISILHDYFGRGADDVVKRLKRLKTEVGGGLPDHNGE